MQRILATTLLALGLAGCSEPPPSAEAIEQARQRADTMARFQASAPFTLHCRGNYNLRVDDKPLQGTQDFSVSVVPARLEFYMFGFTADGYLHGPHRGMDETVARIDRVQDDEIGAGVLRINRRTLRYDTAATIGVCTRQDPFRPIPEQRI